MTQDKKNISLQTKIQAVVVGVAFIAVLLIILIAFFFYHTVILNRTRREAALSTDTISQALNRSLDSVVAGFISTASTSDFSKFISQMESHPENVISHTNAAQTFIREFIRSHYLIDSGIIIAAEDWQVYSLYQTAFPSQAEQLFAPEELSAINNITLLSERTVLSSDGRIPLIFPIALRSSGSQQYPYAIISNEAAGTAAYVVLFVHKEKLLDVLKYDSFTSIKTENFVIDSDKNGIITYSDGFSTVNHQSLVYASSFPFFSSTITYRQSIVPTDRLALVGQGGYAIIFTGFIILSILPILSIFVTHQIITPIKTLTTIVKKIEDGEYRTKISPVSNDEIGTLTNAVNTMYTTIQEQMEKIKEDENIRYKTELKLLTEQINPHFLYNTLEEIQLEVKKGDNGTASDMIQYLAEYLRIGLSGGADVITVADELKHAFAYVRIMNQRFRKSILFTRIYDQSMGDRMILKTILQPLIENSIRHGFGIDGGGIAVASPSIEIRFHLEEEKKLIINVSDNGSGFDEEKVIKQMKKESHTVHIGVGNVYKRLVAYYGAENISVTARSIPYYRNTISIMIKNAV